LHEPYFSAQSLVRQKRFLAKTQRNAKIAKAIAIRLIAPVKFAVEEV
jgi:hypothetical protein